ncbi:MAG: asparagine synthase (glutamine-hydrolyzing) [Methanomicrobiales archaeon]|nr:asparagine synthase (glutamine-hydrolyzing) [Methanomicrobiales archaeon]
MCGIAGLLSLEGARADERLLADMSARIRHRGPDGSGTYIDGPIGLAHRRLAIIDLTDAAKQPMTNEDGTLRLVFNGEIYNFIELREELAEKGHTFRSTGDTEVILHAYEEWGRECLARFTGMWAFALWDSRKQELFCARDRFGIKPFYYTRAGEMVLFASEIKALLAHPGVGRRPDDPLLLTFLAWGVLDHTGGTMFDGIHQLQPAHRITFSLSGEGTPEQYWDVAMNPDTGRPWPEEDERAASAFRDLLTDAVRLHLRSDVPVGTCLSGGIDSSTLTVVINRLIRAEAPPSVGDRQKTFSIVFADPLFDEGAFIDQVVAAAEVDAKRITIGPEEVLRDLPRLLNAQDEPFASLSIYAQFRVMELASRSVKVVLDGQGADEQLGGYLAYQGSYLSGLLRGLHLSTALSEVAGSYRNHKGFFRDAFSQILVRSQRRSFLRGDVPPVSRYSGSLDQVLKREIMATNLTALLHWEDRSSMAFSIESRVPFLDHRVVEFLATLPLHQKIRNGVTKYILRKAIRGLVPEAIRCRMDKMGFVTPEEVWMKEGLRPFVLEILTSPSFRERKYWDAEKVLSSYTSYIEGRSAYSPEIWRIVCTELWLKQVFDGRSGEGVPRFSPGEVPG